MKSKTLVQNIKKNRLPPIFMVDTWLLTETRILGHEDWSLRRNFFVDMEGTAFCVKTGRLIKGVFSLEIGDDLLIFRDDEEPLFYSLIVPGGSHKVVGQA